MIFRTSYPFCSIFAGILSTLLVSALSTLPGCRRNEPVDLKSHSMQAPTQDEILDSRVQLELLELTGTQTELTDSRNPSPRHDLPGTEGLPKKSSEEIVRQLIAEGRFDQAAHFAGAIGDAMVRNTFLDDIIRNRIALTWQQLRVSDPLASLRETEAEKLVDETIRTAVAAAEMIDDPLRRGSAFKRIAAFCESRKKRNESIDALNRAARSVVLVPGLDAFKARELCELARRLVEANAKSFGIFCCREAEKLLPGITDPFESASALLDLAETFVQIDSERRIETFGNQVTLRAESISDPRKKATVLLRLAGLTLDQRLKEKEVVANVVFQEVKKIVQKTDSLITPDSAGVGESIPISKESISADSIPSEIPLSPTVFSWNEIKRRRNELLARVAKTQAWTTSLEEAWDTIQDIENGTERDDVLVGIVDILLLSEDAEDADAWAEEISNREIREKILQKIKKTTGDGGTEPSE